MRARMQAAGAERSTLAMIAAALKLASLEFSVWERAAVIETAHQNVT